MLYDMTMTSVNLQSMCILHRITILVASMASEFKFDLRFEISNLNYHGIDVHVASKSHFNGF